VAVLCSFIFTISVYGLSLYFIIVCIFMRIKMVIYTPDVTHERYRNLADWVADFPRPMQVAERLIISNGGV